MRKVIRVLLIVLVTMGGLATAGLLYVRTTGLVARLEPGALETRIARGVRSLAIPREVSEQPNPVPATPESLADGRAHYADHCAVCHASDGSGETETGQGMWPKAPDMRLSATQDLSDGELFWIIENGIRFTGMPGWSTGTQEGEDAREGYAELEVDAKVELIRSLIPLGLLHIEEWLDEEVPALAGERYARKAPSVGGRRHGSNPGTVGLAGQRVPIRVPRIRHVTEREIPLRSYEALHGDRAVNDLLLRRVLYGISCRNYAAAAEAIPGAIGLSGSTVSRAFIQASATKLRELQERDLSGEDVVALVLDGKTFAEATMVVALGITMTGDKRFLGFVETDTENEQVLTPFLRSLVERGLDVSQGLLVIVDGGKGLRAAGRKAFRHRALVQRCQWHKRENVVSYLAKREQPVWRQRLQRAYNRPEYDEALAALQSLQHELEDRNQSAAGSLAEGLDETLTLHRLGVYGVLGRSLKTTNGLESINALIEERCAKVDHWQHSSQRQRWLATGAPGHRAASTQGDGLPAPARLRDALKRELKIDTTTSKTKAA